MIAAIVLAAGASSRMGRLKMLLSAGAGRTLLSAAVWPLLEAGLPRVVVVLGCEAERVRRGAGLPEDPRVSVVVNPRWREGMSSSMARGLEACSDAEAVLVALGDQPGLTAQRVGLVLSAFRPGVPAVVPAEGAQPGHPVLFSRDLFAELALLSGDVGAREVLRRHWADVVRLELPPLPDVDTPEDYRLLGGQEGEGLGQ
jgi:molybdenum cofactor cytidylyltransferase